MEVLELDGKKFIKATAVARDLGYTADYVGQLCRGGKVPCHLVGRSWYVEKESVESHKASRYRSTKTKTKEALHEEVTKVALHTNELESKVGVSSSSAGRPHFYSKSIPSIGKYDEDQSELIPVLSKHTVNTPATDVEVEIADAVDLGVKESSKEYLLRATELPTIRFKGKLAVSDYEPKEDAEPREESTGKTDEKNPAYQNETGTRPNVQEKHLSVTLLKDKSPKQVKSSKAKLPVVKLEKPKDVSKSVITLKHTNSSKVVAMTRHVTEQNHGRGALAIENLSTVAGTTSVGFRPAVTYITAALLLAVSLTLSLFAIDYRISSNASNSSHSDSYSFNISNLQSALETLK